MHVEQDLATDVCNGCACNCEWDWRCWELWDMTLALGFRLHAIWRIGCLASSCSLQTMKGGDRLNSPAVPARALVKECKWIKLQHSCKHKQKLDTQFVKISFVNYDYTKALAIQLAWEGWVFTKLARQAGHSLPDNRSLGETPAQSGPGSLLGALSSNSCSPYAWWTKHVGF